MENLNRGRDKEGWIEGGIESYQTHGSQKDFLPFEYTWQNEDDGGGVYSL